jgi:adenosine deaminase
MSTMDSPPSRELLRALPKAELHCHLDGSVRPSTMLELAEALGVQLPADTPDSLREYMLVSDAANLEDYLARFQTTLGLMQRADALERIAYELVEDAAQDGVRYIEIRFSPRLNARGVLSMEEVLEAVTSGMRRAEDDHGTVARIIVCALRHWDPVVSLDLARLAVAWRDRGVVAFDLAGAERGHAARAHADAFSWARSHDLAVTVHAGEGDGADSIRQAVHDCGANRIGHATRLREDPSLAQFVNDRRIALEICLTSNVQTRVAPTYAEHPLREYYDRGMNVVLNTDNRLMSGVSLTDEYALAAEHLGFGFEELSEMALNGFAAAFLPWEQRMVLLDEAWSALERLGKDT